MSISHILQKIAGKDIDLLDRSSDAERTMYNCLGILVILISLLTLVSISFALFLVHFPNGFNPYVSHSLRDYLNLLFIVLLTFVWTLIVFNFYRFSLSSVSTLKQKFTLDLIPRLVIQLFFGILIGVSISLPLAVVVGHHEFKDDTVKGQEKTLYSIKENIELPFQEKLNKHYHDLAIALYQQRNINNQLESKKKIKAFPQEKLDSLQSENDKIDETVSQIQSQITSLRDQISNEKIKYEEIIRSNDGLITNIEKALEKNKRLVFLISIFICVVLVFPSLFQALYIPGIYDFLVDYKNHLYLSRYGILPESRNVFIGTEPVHIPYYTFPEELLREKKLELHQLSKKDAQSILQKESSTSI